MRVALILCVLPLVSSCERVRDSYVEGQGQAQRDIAKGELKIAFVDGVLVSSNAPVTFWEYTDILHRRYNVGWCIHSLPDNPDAVRAWVRGYNEVAGPKVERQVGAQV